MHLLNTIFSLLAISLFVSVSNAAQDKLSRFTALQSKSKAGVLKLDDQLFADLIVAPRNYTAVILLTALGSKYGCQPCNQYQSEYELLSKSWLRQQKHHDPLFFAMLDFSVGEETFKKV
jgi:oligosaccharyltransferase complex subunit gamma